MSIDSINDHAHRDLSPSFEGARTPSSLPPPMNHAKPGDVTEPLVEIISAFHVRSTAMCQRYSRVCKDHGVIAAEAWRTGVLSKVLALAAADKAAGSSFVDDALGSILDQKTLPGR